MNRILLEQQEIDSQGCATISDFRAVHIINVLHGEQDQILKTGTVNGLIGMSRIISVCDSSVKLETNHTVPSPLPWIDIILSLPRPRALKRLIPQIAAMGAGRIILAGAQKVEPSYWGAQYLHESVCRPLLVEGLMQSGTSILPEISVKKNLSNYLKSKYFEQDFGNTALRFTGHPAEDAAGFGKISLCGNQRLLLAIGPEGGWTDEEIALLEEKKFCKISLGPRILRSDTATIALIANASYALGGI